MLNNKLIIEFTKILNKMVDYYGLENEYTPYEEDILVEFLEGLKKILVENDKKEK